jgi:hypothetical protein
MAANLYWLSQDTHVDVDAISAELAPVLGGAKREL